MLWTCMWMCRFKGHVCHGAADQGSGQPPKGLQTHDAHFSERRRACQSVPIPDVRQRERWVLTWRVHSKYLLCALWFHFIVRFCFSILYQNPQADGPVHMWLWNEWICVLLSGTVFNGASVPLAGFSSTFLSFLNDYPLVLSREVLSQEVPYLGGNAEMNYYVEGLHFPDKDFNGLVSINLSMLEPISPVRLFFFKLALLCCLLY